MINFTVKLMKKYAFKTRKGIFMKARKSILAFAMAILMIASAFSVSAASVNYDIFNVEFSEMEFGTTGTHLNKGQSKVFVSGVGNYATSYSVESSKLTVDAQGANITDLDFDLNSSKASYRLSISLNVSTDTTDEIYFTFGNKVCTGSNRNLLKIKGQKLYLKNTEIADIVYGEDHLIDFVISSGRITVLVNGESKIVDADENTYVHTSSATSTLESMRVRVGSAATTNAKVTFNYIKASSNTNVIPKNWDVVDYDFTAAPSGVINEGTVASGLLTINGQKSFYSAPANATLTKFVSEISVKAVSGWVNIYFTNKISAQGYHIQVRNDGDVLLFGGSGNAYIDLIGRYDTSGFAKILFELDTENDVIKVSLDDAATKEYKASTSAYYLANNTDAKGYSRVLIAGHNASSEAQVDYIKVSRNKPGTGSQGGNGSGSGNLNGNTSDYVIVPAAIFALTAIGVITAVGKKRR